MSFEKVYDINIFFDESGKSSEKLHLMGAISIPKSYYDIHKANLNTLIRETTIH